MKTLVHARKPTLTRTLALTRFGSDVSVDAAALRAASLDAWTLPRTPVYRHLLKLPRPDPWTNATVSSSQDDELGNVCHPNTEHCRINRFNEPVRFLPLFEGVSSLAHSRCWGKQS